MATTTRKNDTDDWRTTLLGWTAKQGRILTDEGKATEHYCSERGFPFASNELPHYHLERGDSHQVFRRWAAAASAVIKQRVGCRKRREGSIATTTRKNNTESSVVH
mmetsp:Transcript_3811/g.4969  ORF Transcript_3811/g.4969 Transcript_3811/m.4969 type:complete len:106 (+) Transcript_3811:124-441(+)